MSSIPNEVSSASSEEPANKSSLKKTKHTNQTQLSRVWNKEPEERTRADVELLAHTFAAN